MSAPASFVAAPAVLRLFLKSYGGYRIVRDLASPGHLRAMQGEAVRAMVSATESHVTRYDDVAWRGGSPARKFLSAHAGPVQEEFYRHPDMTRFLEHLLDCRVTASGTRGTYTYYSRPGDFIGIHRDVDVCDVAVITCLHDSQAAKGNAGKLVLYPHRLHEDNLTIRGSAAQGAVLHRLALGETMVMLGGAVAHAVLPVEPAQVRLVSVLCYRASES